MAPHSLVPGSAGTVADADLSERGSLTSGFTVLGSESALSSEELTSTKAVNTNDRNSELLRDAHRGSAFLGLSLTEHMEFILGLHGTYEHVDPAERSSYLIADEEEERSLLSATGHSSGSKQTGFADASLVFKIGLVRNGPLKLSIAPFLESGAGEQATYSLTRSVSPKAGWMALATYGTKGIALVSVNAGYRYRNPESVGSLTLRNELFYKTSMRGYINRSLSLFVAADARKIMVNSNDVRDDAGKLKYVARETGAWQAGATAHFMDADWTASYGGKFQKAKGFGFGERSFGMAVSYKLGNVEGRREKPTFSAEVQKEMARESSQKVVAEDAKTEADKAKLAEGSAAAPKKIDVKETYPEMIGTEIDPLELFKDENDDFSRTEKKMAAENKDKSVSPDQQVEDELAALKEKEAQEEKALEEREKAEAEIARSQARKKADIDRKKMDEWMQEANGELEEVEGITDQEMNWNGLD
jgi:hypothetical protein